MKTIIFIISMFTALSLSSCIFLEVDDHHAHYKKGKFFWKPNGHRKNNVVIFHNHQNHVMIKKGKGK